MKRFEEGKLKPSMEQIRGHSQATRGLCQQWELLVLEDGVLHRRFESQDGLSSKLQLIVPKLQRVEVLRQLHDGPFGGHLGEEKTLKKLRERFYWPGHQKDVKNYCNTCKDCTARKTMAPKNRAPLHPITVGCPMQMVGMDFLGPLPETDEGNQYILVVGDHFTKYMAAFAVPNQETSTVARILVDEYFCEKGSPSSCTLIKDPSLNQS